MSVVQRCPQCGTTSATPGECQACHAAEIRYFCTNHSKGLWLDGPACPRCGARLGDPAPPVTAPAASARTRLTVPARHRARPAGPAGPPSGGYSRSADKPEPTPAAPSRRDRLPAAAHDLEPEPDVSGAALWQQLLRAALRARFGSATAPTYERTRRGRGPGGCLRVLLLVVVLVVALLGALLMFGWSLLQGF